jgi:sortase A
LPRQRSLDDLSKEELRQLLVEKSRKDREARIDAYKRIGRVIPVPQSSTNSTFNNSRTIVGESLNEPVIPRRKRDRKRENLDRFLMSLEIVAVVGLAVIIIFGIRLMNNLNRQVSESLVQPSITPTALFTAVVLPGGHTPPVNGQEVVFNEAEIPEHLRPLMQSLANLPVPTTGPQQATRIQIPAINIDAPVVQGDGWEQMKKGVGQHIGTADPGQSGNLVLSAHNDVFGELFRDLDKLKEGDQVVVYTAVRAYTYVITGTQIVDPTRVDVMAATKNSTLTLISCYPYRVDNKRIVVTAELQSNS